MFDKYIFDRYVTAEVSSIFTLVNVWDIKKHVIYSERVKNLSTNFSLAPFFILFFYFLF